MSDTINKNGIINILLKDKHISKLAKYSIGFINNMIDKFKQ